MTQSNANAWTVGEEFAERRAVLKYVKPLCDVKESPRCQCGCGAVLGTERRREAKWASKSCYQRAYAKRRKSVAPGYIAPSGHWIWKRRCMQLLTLLREIGPLPMREIALQCRRRFGWTAAVTTNAIAWSHPVLVESGGVWRLP